MLITIEPVTMVNQRFSLESYILFVEQINDETLIEICSMKVFKLTAPNYDSDFSQNRWGFTSYAGYKRIAICYRGKLFVELED